MGETAIRPTGRAHTITMTEKDIIHIIREDEWMMSVLRIAEGLHLPDWWIGAGFVRSKVWDHLHGYKERTPLPDVDIIYFDKTIFSQEKLALFLQKRRLSIRISSPVFFRRLNGA